MQAGSHGWKTEVTVKRGKVWTGACAPRNWPWCSFPPCSLLSPSATELQPQLEASAKAGVSHRPSGKLPPSAKKTFVGSSCSNARSSKASELLTHRHTGGPPSPHLPFSLLGAMVATSPSAAAPATLPESFPGWGLHEAPTSLQAPG